MVDPTPATTKVQFWLLGIVAAGFLSWSIAVFKATNSVEILAGKLLDLEHEADKHNDQPWHAEAGHLIRLQAEQLARLEALLTEIRNGEK